MRSRMFLSVIFILTSSIFASGQTRYFDIETVRKGKSFTFPIIRNGANRKAETKINRLLQLSELMRLVKQSSRTNIFEQTMVDDGSIYGGKVWMQTTIYSNKNRILSLGFDESSCGMTCTYWHRYYNFNPGNGDRIELRDLFTPEGYERFSNFILERRSSKYRKEIKKKVAPEYQEGFLGTIGCFENDDLTDYYIQNLTIVIDGENCLIKGQKFDGLDMYIRLSLSEFRQDLNDYGRSVFRLNNSAVSNFRSCQLPQLFEGHMDETYPIVMVLNREYENGIRGAYAYLKYGEGLGLAGNETADGVNVTEYVLASTWIERPWGRNREYVENGSMSGRLRNGVFDGTWCNKGKTTCLPLLVTIR